MGEDENESEHFRSLHEAQLRAIMYLRNWAHGPECAEYCERMGYRASVVLDPPGSRYVEVIDAVVRGDAEVIVVWKWADLPRDRIPRIEPVDQLLNEPEIPNQRRPKVVRPPQK